MVVDIVARVGAFLFAGPVARSALEYQSRRPLALAYSCLQTGCRHATKAPGRAQ